ncbi:aldehyde dehydrogenase [Ruegeria arenilitoris]|uniref:aldehyde dehydrogenase n=1 Tax=Ruegeria arenilitoris TaxID=1173585 RepID=UPI00147D3120|nr:aldehyde dehydrogenase [Ruegeria arenilitoris]
MGDFPVFRNYIDGSFVEGSSTFESINPSTGETWAIMPAAGAADTARAVEAANRAFLSREWAGLTPTARGKLLYRLADLLAENAQDLAEIETIDTGKIIRETKGQVGYTADYVRYFAGLADKIEGSHLPIDKEELEVYLRREPIGVVAAIVPWNSQLFLAAVKFGPALAAGCTIVLKASEDAPGPLLKFAELVDEAGFPPGVFNVITGFGEECGQVLTSHPDVARIAFTGGPGTARQIVQNSAENLAYTTLELGGKSPVIVFDDVNLDSMINGVVAGIFGAAGQSCVAGSRLLVQRRVKDELIGRLKAKAEDILIGDPSDPATEYGPLATKAQIDKVERVVESSIAAGAILITGGARPEGYQGKQYYLPTILDCSNVKDADSVTEELFGPVLSVLTFDTEDEAIAMANSTNFGLAGGVFTNNLARAHRMIRAVRSGIIWVNTYRVVSPIAPFGGFGESGLGREGGMESVLDYTRAKTVWINTSDAPIPDPFKMR